MPALKAEGIGFARPGREPLFDDVHLTLEPGELVVLIGRNGCGKTTLLRILAGLLAPTRGRVFIGEPGTETRQRVGILFQNPDHQMIAATVEEEIALGLELRGAPPEEIRQTVDALLGRFQLAGLRHSPPEALSGGQKQRVALAAIMASQPPFLLFDEPDSFLDAPSRRELMRGVNEVRGRCGILWVMPHARQLPDFDRCLVLEAGGLRECAAEDLSAHLARWQALAS